MKTIYVALISASMILAPAKHAFADDLDQLNENTEKLWRRGQGSSDGSFTAVACSMMAWGVGISVVAAVLAILINSEADDDSDCHCHSCH